MERILQINKPQLPPPLIRINVLAHFLYLLLPAVLLAACTQDETLSPAGDDLPADTYPLQIGNITITTDEQPWTRVGEKPDGSGSVFQDGDRIGVRIAGSEETGIYRIKVDDAGNVTITPYKPVYWKSTQPAEVTAWYPAEASSVNLGLQLQNNTMTYVLHGTGTGNHQSPVTLKFTHQLAKVRVVAKGTAEVGNISIWNVPTIYFIEEGKITGLDDISTGHIQMLPVDHDGIGTCWEASVGPDVEIKYFNINLMDCELTSPVTTQAGALHTITITANSEGTQTIDLSNGDYTINDDRTYYFSGTASHAIRVTGGSPNIYLEDAEISVTGGNAIDITSGNPTIHVKGNDNDVSSSDGAGIYVAENSSVTITGRSREDVLTARGGNGGNGIGGYTTISGHTATSTNSGNISVSNVTVYAYGSDYNADVHAPGIGGAGSASCGTITIDNATVYAYGTGESYYNVTGAAIGGGINADTKGSYSTITIENGSEVYVQRGNFRSDYIGHSGSTNNPATATDGIDAMVDETSTVTKLN